MKSGTIFILGSGPGLNDVDLSLVAGKTTLAFNRSYIAWDEWGFKPTYYMAIDMRVIKASIERLKEMAASIEVACMFINAGEYQGFKTTDHLDAGANMFLLSLAPGHGFKPSWNMMKYCGDVGACSIQVAAALGYSRAVLLGTDCKWKPRPDVDKEGNEWIAQGDKDINHFRPDYYGVGQMYSDPFPDAHFASWKATIQGAGGRIEILSSTPYSRLNELVPYIELEKAVQL